MKYRIALILIAAIALSCSTTKTTKTSGSGSASGVPPWKTGLKTLYITGNMSTSYHDETMAGSATIFLAGTDSLSMTFYGPFGITVGMLYARPDYFIFYNAMNNELLEGVPTAKNMNRATMLPLSYNDLVKLIMCETPGNPENFEPVATERSIGGAISLYRNFSNDEYVEYAVVTPGDSTISQYQRKLRNGSLILNLSYQNYEIVDGYQFSKKLLFNFPEIDGSLSFDVEEIQPNKELYEAFTFKIPSKVKRLKLE